MFKHVPVLVEEVIKILNPSAGDVLLDATIGTGGHSFAFLEAMGSEGKVVGLDADPEALRQAAQNLAVFGERVELVQANFGNLKDSLSGGGILTSMGGKLFSQILFDLGIGSHQLSDQSRGFSFNSPGPLAMRYGQQVNLPESYLQPINYLTGKLGYYPDAADLIRYLKVGELAELIKFYGQERMAGRIAKAVKLAGPDQPAWEMAQVVRNAVPRSYERGRIDPATRTWQSLRLAVNRELECLSAALPQAVDLLEEGGIIAVISFHSLEDRIVKRYFKGSKDLEILTKKPITASSEERAINPRSRSAKLRAARKI